MAMTEDSLVELSAECDFVELGTPQDHSLPCSLAEADVYAMIETMHWENRTISHLGIHLGNHINTLCFPDVFPVWKPI